MFTTDFLIIGGGIVGLCIARELVHHHPHASIILVDKEAHLGLHASGRNSGVLHSGIYYVKDSLKAKFCRDGAQLLKTYCSENNLSIDHIGKVIIPTSSNQASTLDLLHDRGIANGVNVEKIDQKELQQLEPEAYSATGYALFTPDTAVVNPKAIIAKLEKELLAAKVRFLLNTNIVSIDPKNKIAKTKSSVISYGHLFNCAGVHADKVASQCGLDNRYSLLPFKGIYYQLRKDSNININRLIYPVPDLNMPFLGVHYTKSYNGDIYLGPTAIPALGREHYSGIKGINAKDSASIAKSLFFQLMNNNQGIRTYMYEEASRFIKKNFVSAAQLLTPKITKNHLVKSTKIGIRAQLFDNMKKELVMDFVVEKTPNETHILNAVSPAFTCSMSFAKFVVDKRI